MRDRCRSEFFGEKTLRLKRTQHCVRPFTVHPTLRRLYCYFPNVGIRFYCCCCFFLNTWWWLHQCSCFFHLQFFFKNFGEVLLSTNGHILIIYVWSSVVGPRLVGTFPMSKHMRQVLRNKGILIVKTIKKN